VTTKTIQGVSDELWEILQRRLQEGVDAQDAIVTSLRGF
jgi:hypothetical protein